MRVSELFESIQGEGLYLGSDTTFVRLCGCSTGCSWCDTKYAWDEESGEEYDPTRLFLAIGGMRPTRVCFTGGEPLEQNQEQLATVMESLSRHGFDIHIETCGLIPPTDKVIKHVNFWSISPKLSNASPRTMIQPLQLQTLYYKIEEEGVLNGQWKFVIKTEEDVLEAKKFLVEALGDDTLWPVVLQPLNDWPLMFFNYDEYFDKIKTLKTWAEIYFDGYDWRVLPQLHLLMWKGARQR
ncbi:7-carboxy-7-deazaguanine synthase QueE [bacterium]|nr:MAG: 7-carboxy-7-deazaguanine synthase QueE [bacterium]